MATTLDPQTSCWVLTNGMAGFETQGLGIAEALGLTPVMKRVTPPAPYRWLAPHGPAAPDANIKAPWPDILIASGRQSIPYARMIKRASKGRTFVVILQNPRVPPRHFDLVWAPAHDQLSGPNVISTLVSPHRLTRKRLTDEAAIWEPQLAHLPRPRVAVLIGGKNAIYDFDEAAAAKLAHQLAALIDKEGVSLMVTPSRRTGERQTKIIKDALAGKPALVWDGSGDNPYFGFLGQADAVIVTSDSVNMVGEAAFTGKPVYVVELTNRTGSHSVKFRRFLDAIYQKGAARPFVGPLESWEYAPLNATHDIAEAIATRLPTRHTDPT
ncbi:MAG: mitochondrial fission ELM1 family protein [Pseudomonadota bacterium]